MSESLIPGPTCYADGLALTMGNYRNNGTDKFYCETDDYGNIHVQFQNKTPKHIMSNTVNLLASFQKRDKIRLRLQKQLETRKLLPLQQKTKNEPYTP